MRKLSLVLFGLIVLAAPPVLAQKTNPLDGQPEVRRRLMLRDSRFEVAPQVGFAINRDFYHTILFGLKAEYHISDWISIGANFGYGAVNVRTGLADNILGQLPDSYDASTAKQLIPSKAMAEKPMLKLNMLVGAQANVTPFFGKMALFSKLFFNYDFYGFVGFGAALYADKCGGSDCIYNDASGAAINYKNPTEGFKPGITFGAGFHFFFNNWIALNAEIRDTALPNVNLAGRDMNWDPQRAADGSLLPPLVNSKDKSWDHILTVLLGCSFYLPTDVKVSK